MYTLSLNREYILILILVLYCTNIFSQDNTLEKSKESSIQINCLSLLYKDFTITYSKYIRVDNKFEIDLGYRFAFNNLSNHIWIFNINDAFWYYNQISSHIGIGKYLNENIYIVPMALYNYSFFNNKYFKNYIDLEGEYGDEDYIISRHNQAFGVLVKGGYTFRKGILAIDLVLGIGCKAVFKEEFILNKINSYGNIIPANYPIITHSHYIAPTLHFGLLFGIILN